MRQLETARKNDKKADKNRRQWRKPWQYLFSFRIRRDNFKLLPRLSFRSTLPWKINEKLFYELKPLALMATLSGNFLLS